MTKMNINLRVLLLALVPALTIALLLSVYFARGRLSDLERSLSDRGLAIARQLAPAAEFGVFSGNKEILNQLVVAMARETDVIAVTVHDASGNVLAQSGNSTISSAHDTLSPAPRQSDEDAGRTLVSSAPIIQSQVELEEFFNVANAQSNAAQQPAPAKILGRVYVAVSKATLTAQRKQLFIETLAITLLVLAANIFLALRMSRNVSRPLTKLTHAVQKLADGNLDTRVISDPDSVLGSLENGVNTMAAALKSAHANLEQRITDATLELEQKKEEAERANTAKSRFLAVASHDLRQPMHALGLFVASLHDKPLPEEVRRVVSQIDRSVFAMQDLLEALLDISRLDAGVVTANVSDFSVNRLLMAMHSNFSTAARNKGVTLRMVPCSDVVHSDPILLERILLNLISNALRYTAHGKIIIGCRRHGHSLRIEVWDTGVGIAPDQQAHIFEEFYRISEPESESQRGLGLGLAIVDRLARLLDHRIEVRSTIGKGSMFAVCVPRIHEVEELSEPVATEAVGARFGQTVVMVIDDDPLALNATRALLESWGCRVFIAESGAAAQAQLAALDGDFPKLFVCDYRLGPEETGVQLLDRLRAIYADDIRAILVSGDTSAEVARAAAAGGYPLLHKPLRPAKLRTLAQHLLTRAPRRD